MSFKEIKELRQAGKLDEALLIAKQALETDPENIWNKRGAAWVFYDYLKKYAHPDFFELFKENLIKIKDLHLPEDEKMVFDNCAWQIGSMVFNIQKSEQIDYTKINELFEIIRYFNFTKPSEAYSFIYKSFHKGYQNWSSYISFAEWWNFENFRSEDYLKEEFNGKKIMSIVEQAYIAFSKKIIDSYIEIPVDFIEFCNSLIVDEKNVIYSYRGISEKDFVNTEIDDYKTSSLEGFPNDSIEILKINYKNYLANFHNASFPNPKVVSSWSNWRPFYRTFNKNQALEFMPKLDFIIDKHPEYQYLPYFKAKLLLKLGETKDSLSAFIPFAKQKRNDFWIWELMAEIFSNDKDIQFNCYCKALSLKTPEDFLVKLRQTFAEILIENKMYSEAKTEILKIIATREKNEWKLPNQITQWLEQDWYKSANAKKDNQDLYSSNIKKAEEILFQDIREETVVVEYVNENKNMLNFVCNKQKHGFFNYSSHFKKLQTGDILKVRFSGEGQDGFYKILTAKKVDSKITSDAIRDFEGTLKVISPQNFGFIDDNFIEPKLIHDYNLKDGQKIKGKAILSFNKKKNEWGWKTININ